MNRTRRRWSPIVAPALALAMFAIGGCGQPAAQQAQKTQQDRPTPKAARPYAPPTIGDALSSNMSDRSCTCVETENCVQLSDAVAGYHEGRHLSCTAVSKAGTVDCVLEERFVEMTWDKSFPGPWATVRKTLKLLPTGGWCEF